MLKLVSGGPVIHGAYPDYNTLFDYYHAHNVKDTKRGKTS